jgi:hypothetical protein
VREARVPIPPARRRALDANADLALPHRFAVFSPIDKSTNCVVFTGALQTVAHYRMTSLWQADAPGATRLEPAFHTLFEEERGKLILDETVMPDPSARAIEGMAEGDARKSDERCLAPPSCI